MKKVLMVAAMLFAGLFTYCYGQDVKVNINNHDYSTEKDCEFKINGICSSEDIGGVDIQGVEKYHFDGDRNTYFPRYYAVLTNYNEFSVTVLFEYNETFTTVLRKGETKNVQVTDDLIYCSSSKPCPDKIITLNIKGPIVRRLQQ